MKLAVLAEKKSDHGNQEKQEGNNRQHKKTGDSPAE
jgi:hypothetical protein